jgi:hypothetical protein
MYVLFIFILLKMSQRYIHHLPGTRATAPEIQSETEFSPRSGRPVFVTVRPLRTVTNIDGAGLTWEILQLALAEEVLAQVQRYHPTWSEDYIYDHVRGLYIVYFRVYCW